MPLDYTLWSRTPLLDTSRSTPISKGIITLPPPQCPAFSSPMTLFAPLVPPMPPEGAPAVKQSDTGILLNPYYHYHYLDFDYYYDYESMIMIWLWLWLLVVLICFFFFSFWSNVIVVMIGLYFNTIYDDGNCNDVCVCFYFRWNKKRNWIEFTLPVCVGFPVQLHANNRIGNPGIRRDVVTLVL